MSCRGPAVALAMLGALTTTEIEEINFAMSERLGPYIQPWS
ncbi:hypothetical protein [Nostocoides vanveenii]